MNDSDWEIGEVIGDGAYAEVRLTRNKLSNEEFALKIIDLNRCAEFNIDKEEFLRQIKKEVQIHRKLIHPNVVRFFGTTTEISRVSIILEHAPHGELFHQIKPDIGIPAAEAQYYFRQLIEGLEYLHSRGIVHRDLKPENLLLDDNYILKICDFGLATLYKYQGSERMLDRVCGTVAYAAPEIIARKPHRGPPLDIWSCGIILIVMLCGDFPWDKANKVHKEYLFWFQKKYTLHPWPKIDQFALNLLIRMLDHEPDSRYTIQQIKRHPWFLNTIPTPESDQSFERSIDERPTKRMKTDLNVSEEFASHIRAEDSSKCFMTQPAPPSSPLSHDHDTYAPNKISFSQPATNEIVLTLLSRLDSVCTSELPLISKRMTRFFMKTSTEESVKLLCDIVDPTITVKKASSTLLTLSTVDRRKMQLIMKISFYAMKGKTLVDFRLARGDGLEMKRQFQKIKESLNEFLVSNLGL